MCESKLVTLSLFAARRAITLIGVVENGHAGLTRGHKTELSRLFISAHKWRQIKANSISHRGRSIYLLSLAFTAHL
jgi:hypothetical protein